MTGKPRAEKTPYDGTRIFKAARPLDEVIASLPTYKGAEARVMAGPDTYRRLYAEAEAFLQSQPTLSVKEAAQKQGVSESAFIALADKGEALLIEFNGKQYVPACSFGADGKIDALKVDIAREFVLEGHQHYFKFMDYMKFMHEQQTDIVDLTMNEKQLSALFNQAGLAGYRCSISVMASMNQLADHRHKIPAAFDRLMQHLDSAVTHGGWDPMGGLSRPFRDKYGIPGQTIHEQRTAYVPPAPRKEKPANKGPQQ